METNSVKLIYFSPTRTTKKIVEEIARGIEADKVEHIDLTLPGEKMQTFGPMQDDLVVIGAPVYGGRLPAEAVHRLQRLTGTDTPAVIIVVYGNRAFEDAILELRDLALAQGFRPVAGGAFIGEHSFSHGATPIAHGRPDEDDLLRARKFGVSVRKKMGSMKPTDQIPLLRVPGNSPYKERRLLSHSAPVVGEALCTRCESCVEVCPTASIALEDTIRTDSRTCIACCACIKQCPVGARAMDDPEIRRIAQWLSTSFRQRKEPETYL
jgi:ferredoxin